MAPTLDPTDRSPVQLADSDVAAIQRLYGAVDRPSPAPTASPGPCRAGVRTVRAVINTGAGYALVEEGGLVWQTDRAGQVVEEGRSASQVWPGLPRPPDAGFTWHNGLTYLFLGNQRFVGLSLLATCQNDKVLNLTK